MRDMSDLYLKNRFKVYLDRKECGKSIGQWRQSAQNGDAEALFRLALCNKQGLCCGRSMKNYMTMMKESADLGFTEAALSLGLHLISTSETGSEQRSEGLAYLKKAAESGDSQVQARVAIELVLSGDAEDQKEAVVWAEKASESGNEFAQYILGRMLEEGCAVEKDMQRAAQLYCQCQNEVRDANFYLGRYFEQGPEDVRDAEKAYKCYSGSAHVHPSGSYCTARCLEFGIGTQKCLESARFWYFMALKKEDCEQAAEGYRRVTSELSESEGKTS